MLRWKIAILVAVAIAISDLDRQALPVAIQAIARDIPVSNEQFSQLQSAFLIAYAFLYAGGGKLMTTAFFPFPDRESSGWPASHSSRWRR